MKRLRLHPSKTITFAFAAAFLFSHSVTLAALAGECRESLSDLSIVSRTSESLSASSTIFSSEFVRLQTGAALKILEEKSTAQKALAPSHVLSFNVMANYRPALQEMADRIERAKHLAILHEEAARYFQNKALVLGLELEGYLSANQISYLDFLVFNRKFLIFNSLYYSIKDLNQRTIFIEYDMVQWDQKFYDTAFAAEIEFAHTNANGFFLLLYKKPTAFDHLKALAYPAAFIYSAVQRENPTQLERRFGTDVPENMKKKPLPMFESRFKIAKSELKENAAYSKKLSDYDQLRWVKFIDSLDAYGNLRSKEIIARFLKSLFRDSQSKQAIEILIGREVTPTPETVKEVVALIFTSLQKPSDANPELLKLNFYQELASKYRFKSGRQHIQNAFTLLTQNQSARPIQTGTPKTQNQEPLF